MPSESPLVSFCERVTPQEYQEQTLITSEHSLKDLLNKIAEDESLSSKERRKQLKQVSNFCWEKVPVHIHTQDFYCEYKIALKLLLLIES